MLTLIGWLLFALILIPNAVIAVELLCGGNPKGLRLSAGRMPRVAVLVPAHDEAAGIGAIVARVLPVLPSGARLLVVADNCTDDTAARARAAGAEVTERHDPDRRGKGYALAHGREVLAADPPEVVIVLDADCWAEPRALERIARGAVETGRPVQAAYLLEPRPEGSPNIQISGFAFLVKNLVREAGLERIGAPVVLTGSGMAFPWSAFVRAPLATADIVEDLAIGIALAREGLAPRFDAQARIWTAPSSGGGTLGQRTRWEHGFIATARRVAPALVAEGIGRGRPGLAWLGLHIAVPPLALLLALDLGVLLLLWLLRLAGMGLAPLALTATLLVPVIGGVVFAWLRHGRDQVRAGALARAPLYLLWKLPIYLRLVKRRETAWVRTERDETR